MTVPDDNFVDELEYLSIWEKIHNVSFNYPEFEVIEKESGVNRFTMSVGQ